MIRGGAFAAEDAQDIFPWEYGVRHIDSVMRQVASAPMVSDTPIRLCANDVRHIDSVMRRWCPMVSDTDSVMRQWCQTHRLSYAPVVSDIDWVMRQLRQ
ncbi:MAG: hypothetical protein LBK73_03945 [Treponema sp.]|nr:hypothetical protein [Treponema sp.]